MATYPIIVEKVWMNIIDRNTTSSSAAINILPIYISWGFSHNFFGLDILQLPTMPAAFSTAAAATALFSRHLSSPSKRKRAPTTIKKLYLETIRAHRHHTGQIFLRTSFHAWLAYFLARSAAHSQRHYQGQKADSVTLATFDRLSPAIKEATARRLDDVEIHESVLRHLKVWRPICEALETIPREPNPRPYSDISVTPEMCHSPERIHDDNQGYDYCSRDVAPQTKQATVFQEAEMSSITPVFSALMHDVVVPVGTARAQITTTIPLHSHVDEGDCTMEILIRPEKVGSVAANLFDIQVATCLGTRYIVHNAGVHIIPEPTIILQGAHLDIIETTLGSQVAAAISDSHLRQAEQQTDATTRRTRCVNMQINKDATQPCVLTLYLGAQTSIVFARTLYGLW
ncbi:hypothetical protein GGS20DRAFT_585415 [Poronia punctata]|nr:hypothetical protein GGS20DRAFT_585415 [Poronia punctata]